MDSLVTFSGFILIAMNLPICTSRKEVSRAKPNSCNSKPGFTYENKLDFGHMVF
jgi:hypothetical protein